MAKEIKIGQQDYTVLVFIPDPASTDGSGKTGLLAANLTVSCAKVKTDNDVEVTDFTASLNDLAALTTIHTDWGVKEVSSTLAPGLYRLDLADSTFLTGYWSAVVYVMITTSAAAASPIEFVMTPQLPYAGVNVAAQDNIDFGAIQKASIQTAATASIVNANLDHLCLTATAGVDMTAEVADGTIISRIISNSDTSLYVPATSNLTTIGANVTIIDDYLDSELAAITAAVITNAAGVDIAADIIAVKTDTAATKLQTDKFVFTVTNANTQYVNDTQLQGNGSVATPWGPV